jgi:hypothetical protein
MPASLQTVRRWVFGLPSTALTLLCKLLLLSVQFLLQLHHGAVEPLHCLPLLVELLLYRGHLQP